MTSTIPTTLTEYQQHVRTEALKVQEDMGWPDEKLNATLKALGLPEKHTFLVPVEVTGKMIVMMPVDDAQSEPEARTRVAEMDADRLRVKVAANTSTGHFGELTGEVISMPEKFEVGDRDLTNSNGAIYASLANRELRRQCEHYQPNASSYCTLRRGHGGDQHAAGNGLKIVAVWPTTTDA